MGARLPAAFVFSFAPASPSGPCVTRARSLKRGNFRGAPLWFRPRVAGRRNGGGGPYADRFPWKG